MATIRLGRSHPSSRKPPLLRLLALHTVVWITTTSSFLSVAEGATSTPTSKITILYDAFGRDPSMKKDWGFSALVEIGGKRILFDTGDDREIFAANARAKGVDFNTLDFVVISHRHSDHIAGLSQVLAVNPEVKIFAPKENFGILVRRFQAASIARTSPCQLRCVISMVSRLK